MFGKKVIKCDNCNSKIDNGFSFCPYCGTSLINEEKHARDYGLLGKGELDSEEQFANFGITDKLIGSLMNSLMKNFDKQFKHLDREMEKTEVRSFPNGIKIKISPSIQHKKRRQKDFFKKSISEDQLKKITTLPKKEAETKVKRLNDKVIYELSAPGIQSPQDIFISKLESGYEIKAIGDKKVYVNSLPVNLPIRALSFDNEKLFIEFSAHQQF